MFRAYATFLASLFGLAFGSFLNVCASRMPEGESIISPGSHCRRCGHALRWRENIPLASWLLLRGRCSGCGAHISRRYPIAESAVAFTWAAITWQTAPALYAPGAAANSIFDACILAAGSAILCWLLILLAVLDAEHFWLPNRLTFGGSLLGLPFALVRFGVRWAWPPEPLQLIRGIESHRAVLASDVQHWLLGIVIAPGILLIVRWSYRIARRREGIGLGDVKLMLLLAVWLGLAHTLLAFVFGVIFGTLFALVLLAVPAMRRDSTSWALTKVPLGMFLCAGGIFSALWGTPLIAAYLRAIGF